MRIVGRTARRGPVAAPVAAVLVAVLLTGLAACSSGGDQETASDEAAAGGGEAASLREYAGSADNSEGGTPFGTDGDGAGGKGPASGDGSGLVNRTTVSVRAVVRTGEVALVAKAMNDARARIDALLGRHGGYLASEETRNDRAGRPERSVLVVRVPEPAFDEMMNGLTGIGRTEHADRSSEDVTTEVIDVDTRVRTQEASIARLRKFLSRATTVDDMIRLEAEIATRQASLESLKAQQTYLRDQTALSTITVRLRTPAAPAPEVEEEEQGFLAGLSAGWSALATVLLVAATATGAVLPFVLTVALLGVPAWLLMRSLARRRRPPVLPEVATEGP